MRGAPRAFQDRSDALMTLSPLASTFVAPQAADRSIAAIMAPDAPSRPSAVSAARRYVAASASVTSR